MGAADGNTKLPFFADQLLYTGLNVLSFPFIAGFEESRKTAVFHHAFGSKLFCHISLTIDATEIFSAKVIKKKIRPYQLFASSRPSAMQADILDS